MTDERRPPDDLGMTAPQVMKHVWSLADKPERMRVLDTLTRQLGWSWPNQFWTEFWEVWTSSESLFMDEQIIEGLVEYGLKLGSPLTGLTSDERMAVNALPERIRIWRGATGHNHMGWSWTTDREKARWFAVRGYGTTERYLMTAEVESKHVLAILDGRGESEVVVNPKHLIDTAIEEEWEAEDVGPLVFWLAQTGQLPDHPEVQAEMMVKAMDNKMTSEHRTEMKRALRLCEWLDLKRGHYFREVLRLTEDTDGEPTDD